MIKRSVLTSIAGIILLISAVAQYQWEIVYQGVDIIVPRSMDFINADTGWMALETGLFRTFDGGENWELLIADKYFRELEFINRFIGWSLGEGDILLKTSDGGVNWDTLTIPDFSPSTVSIIDDSVVYILGEEGTLNIVAFFRTIDGGKSWLNITPPDFSLRSVSPIDNSIVFALGEEGILSRVVILRTLDGGTSWLNITPSPRGSDGSLYFMNKDSGLVIYESEQTTVARQATIARTINGGDTWDIIYPPMNEIRIVKDINHQAILFEAQLDSGPYALCKTDDYFKTWSVLIESDGGLGYLNVDEDLMFAMVDSFKNSFPGKETHILKSTDGGLTWKATAHPPLKNMEYQLYPGGAIIRILAQSVSWLQKKTVIELVSLDDGDHWSINQMSLPLKDIHFTDQYRGFMVAGACVLHYSWGALLTTEDGGLSWELKYMLDGAAEEIGFFDESIGLIASRNYFGGYSMTLGTTDGWDHVEREYNERFHGFNFINDSVGWALGGFDGYWLSKTSDSGMRWEPGYRPENHEMNVNSIFFFDEEKGYAVGNDGLILELRGGDSIRQIQSGTTLPLDQIQFSDADIGIVTGGFWGEEGYGSIMLRTTDGGNHWTEVPDMPYWIHDICFSDSLHGVAVGEAFKEGRGVILETADAGENWDVVTDTLPEPLRALDFEDGIWWAIGDNSLTLKKVTPSTTQNRDLISKNETPFYSYPNPFRTGTFIHYELQSEAKIELTIYDLSGRKIATLVNDIQSAGIHEVTWNAENMEAGIYFCEMRTWYCRQVIKMFLAR